LLDFKQDTETKLLTDIQETNRLSFDKNTTTRRILESFYLKPDNFLKQLGLDNNPKVSNVIKSALKKLDSF
jgi:hypothetical protein